MIKTIKRGSSGLRDADMSVLAEGILSNLTGNTNFPAPTPTLVILKDKLDDYKESLAVVKTDRSKQNTIAKNKRKAELKKIIDSLFDYVMVTAGDNIEIQDTSGFPLAKERQPVGDMAKPEAFKIIQGDGAGEMHLSVKPVFGAVSYCFQFIVSPSPEVDNWTSVNDPSSRITINKLIPGTQYKFRVAAVGARGQGPWSDAITRFVA